MVRRSIRRAGELGGGHPPPRVGIAARSTRAERGPRLHRVGVVKTYLQLLALTVVIMISFRNAAAETEGDSAAVIVLPIVALDASFAIHDIVVAARGEHSSGGYAVVETLLTAPQAIVAIGLVQSNWDNTRENPWGPRVAYLTLATALTGLTVHGIWSLASGERESDKP